MMFSMKHFCMVKLLHKYIIVNYFSNRNSKMEISLQQADLQINFFTMRKYSKTCLTCFSRNQLKRVFSAVSNM